MKITEDDLWIRLLVMPDFIRKLCPLLEMFPLVSTGQNLKAYLHFQIEVWKYPHIRVLMFNVTEL